MNNLKKFLSISIASVAMLSLFAACKKSEPAQDAPEATITDDVNVDEDMNVEENADVTEDEVQAESAETTSDADSTADETEAK